MGAQPSSSPKGGARGNAGVIQHCHDEVQPEREARPARRCLPLAWSGVSETEDENEDEPAKARQPTEAWEARPFSSQSTASTLNTSTGKHLDTLGSFRPTSCGSQMSLPSTASPGSKRSTTSKRSRFSRSGSFPSPAESSGPLREAALCASEMSRPNARELALNDVKLEDARDRATKSLEALQSKLRASRAEAHTEASKSDRRAQGSPTFAAPEYEEAMKGQAFARHHCTSATSEGFSFSASARRAGEEEARHNSRRPARASQVEEVWPRRSMLRPQPSVLGQRYADAADGV